MKKILSFISQANQVLFFIASLFVIGAMTFLVYSEVSSHSSKREVAVVETIAEKEIAPYTDLLFLGKFDEVYAIGVERKTVEPSSGGMIKSKSSSSFSRNSSEGELVNVKFIGKDGSVSKLLESDGLIVSHQNPGSYYKTEFNFYVFRCITKDTDGNKVLNESDRSDVYILSPNGSTVRHIIEDVISYEIVSGSEIVVKKKSGGSTVFIALDMSELKERVIQL